MNVAQAILALRENGDQLENTVPDMIPAFLFASPIPALGQFFRQQGVDDLQYRSNQEWEDLISKEDDPLEAAKMLLDWLADKNQAAQREAGYEEEKGLPDSQRMSRG